MNDNLCGKLDILRKHLPDELNKSGELELKDISDYSNYCSSGDCNTELEKITIGFLWLLGEYFTISYNKTYDENNKNAFFLYIISWFSYQLSQSTKHNTTKINDFYNNHVKNNDKYKKFTSDSNKFTGLDDVLNAKSDLLNINIKNLSKSYDAFKLLCSMYGDISTNTNVKTLSDNANKFVKKYQELKGDSNLTNDSSYKKILSTLSTDYDKLKNKCSSITFPDITANIYALSSEDTSSSSSIGNKLFTVLSIFAAIAIFLGIAYKYSLFGFRKRAQKQYLREKTKNIKKKMVH
ncbi:PIR protein [Plasmodium yoelii]|uniref:PIR protein n=2 Tax=Plasmodium yoelii TaxID=5861 RepID=A0AAF0B2F5_PLAYO|nr:PIR protein [Plasmodium yoelii]WBY54645.1 PIR protein [Plasmodium yoelii yoelii]CDS44164.1 YIR protein [Plasmodium yoelii]VTZ71638.1 PIR protein [Plasmodium yoelii]|eukprot:XP_022810964.1 PIR protein [Plasmodium yoelii]